MMIKNTKLCKFIFGLPIKGSWKHLYLIPTFKLVLWYDKYFTKHSFTLSFVWLCFEIQFGYLKIRNDYKYEECSKPADK